MSGRVTGALGAGRMRSNRNIGKKAEMVVEHFHGTAPKTHRLPSSDQGSTEGHLGLLPLNKGGLPWLTAGWLRTLIYYCGCSLWAAGVVFHLERNRKVQMLDRQGRDDVPQCEGNKGAGSQMCQDWLDVLRQRRGVGGQILPFSPFCPAGGLEVP